VIAGVGAPVLHDVRAENAPADAIELESFVVTGTRTRQAADQAPVRVEVLAAGRLESLGARDFADAMEYLPGVQVESNCQSCNTTEIRLMGLSGAYNQIAFDGLPVLSSLAGVYGVEQIPAGFIERIEVVKGGGSSLYGASAVAGVINVIPRRPVRDGGKIDLRFDSVAGAPSWHGSATFDRVSERGTSWVSGYVGTTRAGEVDLDGDAFTEIARKRLEVAGVRGKVRRGSLEWTADLNFIDEHRRGGNALDVPSHLANVAETLDTRRLGASVALEGRPRDRFDYRIVAAYASTRRDSYYGGLGEVVTDASAADYDAAAYRSALERARLQYGATDNPLWVIEAQFDHGFDRRTLTWGVQGEHERVRDVNTDDRGTPVGEVADTRTFTNVALFVQDDWRIHDRFTLLTGVRVDRDDQLDDPVFSPRVAAKYSASEYTVWRAAVGTGFRAPRIFDEDLHIDTLGAQPIEIVNAPGLRREDAVTANLGVVWNPRALAEVLAFEVNVFGARLQDVFSLSEVRTAADGSLFRERSNAAGAGVLGTEFNVAWSFARGLRADLGAVWQRARHDEAVVLFDDGSGRVIEARRFNKTPESLAVLSLGYESGDAWDWSIGLRWTGPMRVLDNNAGTFERRGGFLVVDAAVGRHIRIADTEWELQFGVRNLTDDRQRDFQSGAGRDSDYVYGPRQPRTWFGRVVARF
jgi:outer membrane receptor for ferrienterochelin and colicins